MSNVTHFQNIFQAVNFQNDPKLKTLFPVPSDRSPDVRQPTRVEAEVLSGWPAQGWNRESRVGDHTSLTSSRRGFASALLYMSLCFLKHSLFFFALRAKSSRRLRRREWGTTLATHYASKAHLDCRQLKLETNKKLENAKLRKPGLTSPLPRVFESEYIVEITKSAPELGQG